MLVSSDRETVPEITYLRSSALRTQGNTGEASNGVYDLVVLVVIPSVMMYAGVPLPQPVW